MNSTGKVLGTIGAMHTLVEKFPMSLLDLFKGKTYTSIFDFIVDVLAACGVPYDQIIKYTIGLIYSIEPMLENNMEHLEDLLGNKDILEQSEFIKKLDYGIKGILMGLMTGIYTCSAKPVLPNKHFDRPCTGTGNRFQKMENDSDSKILMSLWGTDKVAPIYPEVIEIPIGLLDPMGILDFCPTSSDGNAYYMIKGGDKYYKKEEILNTNNILSLSNNTTVENNAIYLSLTNDGFIFNIEKPILETIKISVGYLSYDDNNLCVWEDSINIGEICTKEFKLKPKKNNSKSSIIKWITINDKQGGIFNVSNDTWIYLSKELSNNVVNQWNENGAYSLNDLKEWGLPHSSSYVLGVNNNRYEYKECEYSKDFKNAVRVYSIKQNPTEDDPVYIVKYDGESPNSLYKTYDMNAFIWYCINKGSMFSQTELNHLMWDSRYQAYKSGSDYRTTNEKWNQWFDSKKIGGEFITEQGGIIKYKDELYPILQLLPPSNGNNSIGVVFPSQTYFKPRVGKEATKELRTDKEVHPNLVFNSTIYKFNWDYLNSIQILKPRLMLIGLCNYLLGFSLKSVSSDKLNLTRTMIFEKVSAATKKIIEADDMNIEDCYMSFSNEEFDELLENMLLSRYNVSYSGNDTSTIKVHDVDHYINSIKNINSSATKNEYLETVNKLITEISATPSQGVNTIKYGLEYSGNILQDLIWAIVMPIIESLFTPQVMLLLLINFRLLGIPKFDSTMGSDYGIILNFLINQILGLIKSIVKYVKDAIIELLLILFQKKVLPLLLKWKAAIELEKIECWLEILREALALLPRFKINGQQKIKGYIDDVNYADITTEQTIPESAIGC